MRGAADHWSPGEEWECAAVPGGLRARKGSPFFPIPQPPWNGQGTGVCGCVGVCVLYLGKEKWGLLLLA